MAFQPAFESPIMAKAPKTPKGIFDVRPSAGLASGLKRIGGRKGTTRLGQSPVSASRHGKIRISHKY